MISDINKAIQSGHGNAVVYAGAIGLIVSDIIPTPADALYFYTQQKLKQRLQAGEITPSQYWNKEALAYYSFNPLWWAIVLGTLVLVKGSYTTKMKYGIGLIGAGAVVAIIHQNIKKDQQLNNDVYPAV